MSAKKRIGKEVGFLPLDIGHKLTGKGAETFKWEHIIDMNEATQTCSAALVPAIRSSPTWFVEGFRLRGHQSVHAIQRLIDYAQLDRAAHE